MVRKAQDDETFKPTVLVKDFNMKQTSEAAWLRYEDFENTQTSLARFDTELEGWMQPIL